MLVKRGTDGGDIFATSSQAPRTSDVHGTAWRTALAAACIISAVSSVLVALWPESRRSCEQGPGGWCAPCLLNRLQLFF